MTNITTNSNTGIVLDTPTFSNPVSIASTVSINNKMAGVLGETQAWTVTNSGQITSDMDGVDLTLGGVFIDTAAGTVFGSYGVVVGGPSTIEVSGTITGKGGTAVSFGTVSGNNLLAVYSGAVFGGIVAGSTSASNTLELASSASTGTVSGLGTSFTNFQTTTIDSASNWVIAGSNTVPYSTAFLTDSGTMTNIGTLTGVVTLASGGVLTNASGGIIGNDTFAVIGSAAGVSVLNSGSIIAQSYAINLTAGGTVTNAATGAIDGFVGIRSGGPLTLTNSGTVSGSGLDGVYVAGDGVVTNAASAMISGDGAGIYISGSATIQNSGTIVGNSQSGVELASAGTVMNSASGAIAGDSGINFGGKGGTLLNQGTIIGTTNYGVTASANAVITNAAGALIRGKSYGIYLGNNGTVTNAGTIDGKGGAVSFQGTGNNLLVIDPGAVFGPFGVTANAAGSNMIELAVGTLAGTLAGLGAGSFTNFATIEVDMGANWTLVTDQNTIAAATLINAGTVFNAVTLGAGGILTNTAAGLITSATGGVNAIGADASVSNAGLITTTKFDGVALVEGGTVSNTGTIVGSKYGVYLSASGGSLTNSGAGLITGGDGIFTEIGGTATIVNSGTIVGTGSVGLFGFGIASDGGGSITNAASGFITGGVGGVGLTSGTLLNSGTISGGAGVFGLMDTTLSNAAGALISGTIGGVLFQDGGNTVINAGTIAATGTGTAAVIFTGPVANRMVLDPGAVETGIVAASTSGLDTLELATGVSPSGSLSGLGVSFTKFGTIVIDPSIAWQAYGYNTIASGVQVIDSGKLYVENTLTNSGTISGGIGVGSSGTLTNAAGGTITGADAVKFANMNAVMSVNNSGSIVGTAGAGIWLEGASTVTNAAGGQISGSGIGVDIAGTGTVYNAGTIENTDTLASSATGVLLSFGGSIVNDVAGYIFGGTGVSAGGMDATVVNAGTIVGAGGTAVAMGGMSGNYLVIDPGAVFNGIVTANVSATNAIELASAATAGTISGLGTSFVNFQTITVDAGANWTLAGSNSASDSGIITDYGTLTNSGTLNATVTLETGGTLANGPDGTIATVGVAVTASQSDISLSNAGAIVSTSSFATRLGDFGSNGIYLDNQSGGTISGTDGVYFRGFGTLQNSGTIVGTAADGVYMQFGGTLINEGTIAGGNGTAAHMEGGFTNRLILDPGAVFVGTVVGGSSAAINTMELANGEGGHGTVAGLGVSFTNFATVTVDSGAYWTVTGYGTIAASQTLLDDGILTNAGTINGIVTLDVDGVLTNASGGTITSLTEAVLGTSNNASVVNAGVITGGTIGVSLMSGGQVTNQSGGLISSSGEAAIVSDNNNSAATVVNDGTIAGGFYGVTLSGGSTVTNDGSATITGYGFGVRGDINNVFNAGTIVATGTDGVGVRFNEEIATMTNALSGVVAGQYGVEIDAYQATLVDAGTITGARGAIYLDGFLTNRLVLQPGAMIEGAVLAIASAANVLEFGTASTITGPTSGTVDGLGISFTNFGSITVDADANWTATGYNTIASSVLLTDYGSLSVAGTLTNAGTIVGENTAGSAVVVTKTGTLTNAGTIESAVSIGNAVSLDGGLLINAAGGMISAELAVRGGGDFASTVINQGLIEGSEDGVYLDNGGLVINIADALINGSNVGVLISGSAGTVVNAGTITDSTVSGVALGSGGTVVNAAGALISGIFGVGAFEGIATVTNSGTITGTTFEGVVLGTGGTVVNSGTISGANGTAVAFSGTAQDLLAIDPGAVFNGIVAGSASATNSIELLAAVNAGTISAIGSSFTNFATVTVDPGATWTFSSTNSVESSGVVSDLGTLINTGTLDAARGVEVGGTAATLVNMAGATISGAPFGVVDFGGTVVNYGTLSGGSSFGLGLIFGGSLTNAAGASILGDGNGVYANSSEALTNSGTIAAGNNGVVLNGGGSVTNAVSAQISGNSDGVVIQTVAGTVSNAGTIVGANYYGVFLADGGVASNSAGGSISGLNVGVLVIGDVGTVANSGIISASTEAVYFAMGGTVTNAAMADIAGGVDGVSIEGGAGTVFNSGSIAAASNYGVYINSGTSSGTAAPSSSPGHHVRVGEPPLPPIPSTLSALIVNAASATIFGAYNAVYVKDEVATIINRGTISSSVTQSGTQDSAYGVFINGGGSVTNAASALITGFNGVKIQSVAGQLVNSGTIVGATNYGVYSDVGSSVINTAGAFIYGANYGVELSDGTLVNAGTVAGGGGTAVAFYGTVGNLLVIDPGAVFGGVVAGSASSANSMDLATGGAGTLAGLGTSFTSFGTVDVLNGANWYLDGGNTLADGSTLNNAGTLTLDAGATLEDAGILVNNEIVTLATSTSGLAVADLTGAGIVNIAAGSTVAVQGTVGVGETLSFAGGGNAFLILGDGPEAAGTIGDFGVGDTIDVTDLGFVSGQSTASVAGNVLTVTEGGTTLTFATAGLADGAPVYALNDGGGETDITLTPPSPSGLVLAPASDGGVKGDDLTNVALPTITGSTTPYGTIDLYQGGVLVGTGTADALGAWSVTTTVPLTEGANTFTSTVTDVAGHLSPVSMPPLTVTLDTATPATPGTLSLDPTSDSNVVGDDVTNVTHPLVHGTAVPYGTIDLYDGTMLIGTGTADMAGAWSVAATNALTVGANSLTATATDAAGNVSSASPALVVTLETTAVAPGALTLAPASDSGIAGDDLTNVALPIVTGTGASGSTIYVYDGNVVIGTGTVDVNGTWSVTTEIPIANGPNTLTATATDVAGNISGVSPATVVTLDTSIPPAPGTLTLAPVSDSGVQGDDLTNVTQPMITGTGVAGDSITLRDGDVVIGTGTVAPDGTWTVTPVGPLANGTHTLTADQTSPAGNVSPASTSLSLTVDDVAPAAPGTLVLSPTSDSGTAGDDITNVARPAITGTGVVGDLVTLYDAGAVIGTGTVTAAGTWSVTPVAALASGVHPLDATETDLAGNVSSATANLLLTIQTGSTAPTLAETASVTNPAEPELIGTAEIGATVTVYDGTIALGSAIADGTGHYSFAVPSPLTSGKHQLTAVAADVAGNISVPSATLAVNVNTDNSYAIVSQPDTAGNTVARVYNAGGTLSASDTYDTGGLLVQHVGPDATIRNIYDNSGKLIGTVSGPGAANAVAPQPDFATDRLNKGAQTATDSDASVVNLLSESNNLVAQGNDTVLAGSGTTTVSATTHAVLVAGGTGSLVFAGGSGVSTVLGGSGSSTVFGGSGGGIFQGGSAGNNVLVAGNGNTTLLGGGVGDLLLGSGTGQQLLMGNAAHQTLIGGGSNATLVAGGAGGNQLFGGPGKSEMFASAGGADTLIAGSGSNIMVAKNGDLVFASSGTSTIFGSATGNDVMVGGGTALMVGGNGNDMYSGGGGISTVFSGAGNDTVFTGSGTTTAILGAGVDDVFLGSGTASVFAGGGKDIFATFAGQGGGNTVIAGFKVGTDLVALGGYNLSTVAQQSANGATTLTLTDNTKITLLGINHLDSSSIF